MKTIQKWMGIWMLLGMLAASCTELDEPYKLYEGTMWSGEYEIADGNEISLTVGKIEMFFGPSYDQCTVAFGYKGFCVFTAESYEVRWSRKNRFSLYCSSGGQSLLCFSGVISGDKMSLTALNCDSVATTYELVNVSYQL